MPRYITYELNLSLVMAINFYWRSIFFLEFSGLPKSYDRTRKIQGVRLNIHQPLKSYLFIEKTLEWDIQFT